MPDMKKLSEDLDKQACPDHRRPISDVRSASSTPTNGEVSAETGEHMTNLAGSNAGKGATSQSFLISLTLP